MIRLTCPPFDAIGPLTYLNDPVASSTSVPDSVGIPMLSEDPPQKIALVPQGMGATPIEAPATSLPGPISTADDGSPIPSPAASPQFGHAATTQYLRVP